MKKTAIACGLLAAFAIVSCQVQEQEFAVEEGLTLCRFTVGAEPTKTTMDEHSSVPFISWTTGDKVSVFDAALANRPFEALEDGASTTLEGSMTPFEGEGTYYAVYPYSEDNSLEGTVVTMQLPDKRSVSAAGLAPGTNLSAAKGDGNGMTFYNLCGLLRITVPEDVTTLAKVKISSSGNPLSGKVKVDFSGEVPSVSEVVDGSNSVELTGSFPAGNYYIPVLPGSYPLTVELTLSDGRMSLTESGKLISVERSHVKPIGTVKGGKFEVCYDVEILLSDDAKVTGWETSNVVFSGKLPAGTLSRESVRSVEEKVIYDLVDGSSFTVTESSEKQTFTIPATAIKARHLLVRQGDDLAAALEAAQAGDDIYVGEGTFTGNFTMKEGVNVTGSYDASFTEVPVYEPLKATEGLTTVLDGNAAGRVVTQGADFTTPTTWKNLVIRNGKVTTSGENGGGVWVRKNGILDGCELRDNTLAAAASDCGGGVCAASGSLVTRCYIHSNRSSGKGGGFFANDAKGCFCLVEGNTADKQGGGVALYGGAQATRGIVYNCIVKGNTARDGGGIYCERWCFVYNCLVTGNVATTNVSGIMAGGATANNNFGCNIVNCTVVNNTDSNTSQYAAGVLIGNTGLIMNSVIAGNTSNNAATPQIWLGNKWTFVIYNAYPEGGLTKGNAVPTQNSRIHDSVSFTDGMLDTVFRPVAGSALVNAGVLTADQGALDGSVPNWTDLDLAGGRRQVGAIDLGCYELQ